MTKRRDTGRLHALPAMPPHSRTIAASVDVYLPTIRWTPGLIDQVASILTDTLVRDMQERPTLEPRNAT